MGGKTILAHGVQVLKSDKEMAGSRHQDRSGQSQGNSGLSDNFFILHPWKVFGWSGVVIQR